MPLTCVSPSLLQGTLIQHLKEHVLHGNMTSSDILLYYTTVCPAASCCPSGAPGLMADGCSLYLPWGVAANPELELGGNWDVALQSGEVPEGSSSVSWVAHLYWLMFLFSVPGTEPRSSSMLGKLSTTESHPLSFIYLFIYFEVASR